MFKKSLCVHIVKREECSPAKSVARKHTKQNFCLGYTQMWEVFFGLVLKCRACVQEGLLPATSVHLGHTLQAQVDRAFGLFSF